MRVKVGNKVYDGENEPIMVILTDQDKENITNMHPECTKYCMHPVEDQWTAEAIKEWMRDV